jgi:hypothetical protein
MMSGRFGLSTLLAILFAMGMFGAHTSQAIASDSESNSSPSRSLTSLQTDDPWWASDDESHEADDLWSTDDNGSYEADEPWWASDDESYETDDPWSTSDDTCYGRQCESDRVWWQDETECFGSFCDDDPWNGSTAGCTFGICEDDSFLLNCSYVTVSGYGVEGACDTHLGGSRYDNCYPVSGSGTLLGTNQQTFRCTDAPGYPIPGYSLTDIAPASDDDVVLVLCSSGNRTDAVEPDTCESAPSGIDYYTCQQDTRVSAPIGSDQEWYICER